jgi:branched-chain amino acid transport system substrate-binding protein
MKTPFVFFCALFLCLALFAADSNVVKIGVILPLSGSNSQVGEPQLRAVKLFDKELQTNHYKHTYKVIVEDDQFIPRMTMEAANKLLYFDKVDAMVLHGIAPGNAVAPKTKVAGIPMLCINASYPKIADGKTNFLHWPPVEEEATRLVDLMKKLGCKRIAILSDIHPGIQSVLAEIEKQMKERGDFEIVADYKTNPGELDFRTVMGMIREKKPDTLLPFAISPEIDRMMQQRKQAGLDCRVVTFECFNFMAEKINAEGCYYVSPSIGTTDFQARLKAATGQESEYCVAHEYDAMNLVRMAYEQQDKIDHAKACAWIAGLKDYPSAVGNITTDEHGVIHSPVKIFQIQKGKAVEVKLDDVK